MTDTLGWKVKGESFEDGSLLSDWRKIEQSDWHWQYDTHELSFEIYEHNDQYWKLYRARFVPPDADEYRYDFGGQACRMTLVEYTARGRSPHSNRLMQPGDLEWVRTYEVNRSIHRILKAGREGLKDGASEPREAVPA